MTTVSLLISIAAILISLLALWKTHFAPFSTLGVAGRLRLRIYPIRNDADRWFIASLDVPISVTNEGARPGVITGLRLRLHFPQIPIPGNCEFIQPTYEIATEDADKINQDRFEWVDNIVKGDWMPFAIVPKATVTRHFIFETRWDDPVVQERVDCTLEICSDYCSWQIVTSWHVSLSADVWSELADTGVSMTFLPNRPENVVQDCVPADLHKYTGTKAESPKAGFLKHESHLDYPEQNADDRSR